MVFSTKMMQEKLYVLNIAVHQSTQMNIVGYTKRNFKMTAMCESCSLCLLGIVKKDMLC